MPPGVNMYRSIQGSLCNKRILVVEDEHFMRTLIIQALNSLGYMDVLEAENGKNALALLERTAADIVITDIEMKHLNGLELVRAVRTGKTSLPRDVAVIFLSGLSDISTLSSAAQLDVQAFLVKPVSARQLHEKISEALSAPIEVRPVDVYAEMSLGPTAEAKHTAAAEPAKAPPAPRETTSGRLKHVDVLMLEEGMTLRQDVYARNSLLLSAGTCLMPMHIRVLQDMRELLDDRGIEVELPDPH